MCSTLSTRAACPHFACALFLASVLLVGGCANYLAPLETTRAHPGIEAPDHSLLESLPAPKEQIVAAVYRFRDQTGQYKPSENVASWSTAVTQGATSILMRALEESGWFVVIEREGLSNLLNERQIITSIRAQHTGPNGEQLGPLPPLLYGGVILEGGIIGYDSNVLTGGIGVRYLGAGTSGQYRQDQVTVYLRAVSTQSGRVLKTVHVTKTIVSQKLDAGVFRFVDVKDLLETEAGYTFNEPPVIAVTEAIEEAVRNLVVEGIREDLWTLADPNDGPALFRAYDQELARADALDPFGRVRRSDNRRGFGFGFSAGATNMQTDFKNSEVRPAGGIYLRGNLAPHIALDLSAGSGQTSVEGAFIRNHVSLDVNLLYYVLPYSRLTPFLKLGAGGLVQEAVPPPAEDLFPYVSAAAGFELMLVPGLGFSVAVGNDYPLIEGLDGLKMGRVHDNLWSVESGLTIYTSIF